MNKEFFVSQMEAHSGMLYRIAYTILRIQRKRKRFVSLVDIPESSIGPP